MHDLTIPLTEEDRQRLAGAAAHQAAEALAELLRFIREGDAIELSTGTSHAFDIEVVEKLLDVAKITMEIENKTDEPIYFDICRYIEGWVG